MRDKDSRLIFEAYMSEEVALRGKNVDPGEMKVEPGDGEWLTKGTRDGGEPGDDIVKTVDVELPAQALKPSQSEIFLNKSLSMAIGGVVGGDLAAIISSDNHILDGHHRWAATMLSKPDAMVGGKQSQLPITDLIPVLRAAGIAYGNEGRDGKNDINIYQANIELLQKEIAVIHQGTDRLKPGQASAWFESMGGIDALMTRMSAIQQMPPPKNAPVRKQMPVIDADGPVSGTNEVEDAAARLNKGEIDVYPPYAER